MFDFFKLSAPAKYSEQLLKAENLDFRQTITKDGVIITTADGYNANRATIKSFDIIVWEHPIKPHRIEIKGSFHKLHEGETNYKNFYFNEFRSAVNTLCDSLNIPPSELCIHLFEIGVNIKPPIETKFLIEGVKSLSGKKFERETYNGKGLLLRFDFAHYQIKVYDKGFQFAQPEQILRFEVKVKRMAFINEKFKKKGNDFKPKGAKITTLQNLMSGDWNDYFGNILLTQWDKVIICPEGMINPNLITNPRTRENFINGLNPDYWTGLNSKAYIRQFKRFKEMFKQFAPIDIYSVIYTLIKEKWEYISNELNELKSLPKEQRGKYYPYVYGNNVPFDNQFIKGNDFSLVTMRENKKNDFNTVTKGLIKIELKTGSRFCVSCGRDISDQKTNSKFCSELKYGPSAKKCRNLQSNPRNNRKRKEQRIYPGLTLFPLYLHYGIM